MNFKGDGMNERDSITTGKLYNNLFTRLKNLVIQPYREWESIQQEDKSINEILTEFSLPLISLCTLSTFINFSINRQGFNLELALQQSVAIFTALFGGLFLAWILLKATLPKFDIENSNFWVFKLVAYTSGLLYVVTFFTSLFPEFIMLHLITFYNLYVIWQAISTNKISGAEQKLIITIYIAVLIHFIPFFVNHLVTKLFFF